MFSLSIAVSKHGSRVKTSSTAPAAWPVISEGSSRQTPASAGAKSRPCRGNLGQDVARSQESLQVGIQVTQQQKIDGNHTPQQIQQ